MNNSTNTLKTKSISELNIQKVLIANRGEIASRIIRTLKKMNIVSFAIYSEEDKDAQFVKNADFAFGLGGQHSNETYLNIEKIIKIAKENGVDAIHPGYGFLSENAAFSEACEENQLIFIGPSADAISSMGIKDAAKTLMNKAGVPILPGYQGNDQSVETIKQKAIEVGLPIIIKAIAGGGGKGMRIVHKVDTLEADILACQNESLASFGQSGIMLEKYLEKARHIEVQVFGDKLGNIVHLFDRDCSIQRRYQKIIEEAPSTGIPLEIKEKMFTCAVNACQSIGYYGAGTLEFLYQDNHFYFMEMNTRLQVEHPVTEAITGIDCVMWQILIAENKPLPLSQAQIKSSGHAIECRLYAEDPLSNFMPSIGTIEQFIVDNQQIDGSLENGEINKDIRLDTGFIIGEKISVFYDPMIAKLVVHADSRTHAIDKLERVLTHSDIVGPKTNCALLLSIIKEKDYRDGFVNTHYLQTHKMLQSLPDESTASEHLFEIAALIYRYKNLNFTKENSLNTLANPWYGLTAWHNNHETSLLYWVKDNNTSKYISDGTTQFKRIKLSFLDKNQFNISDSSKAYYIQNVDYPNSFTISFDYQKEKIYAFVTQRHNSYHVFIPKLAYAHEIIFSHQVTEKLENQNIGHLSSPLPGIIRQIYVQQNDDVNQGQKLMTIEAMKMEHTLYSPKKGKVNHIFYTLGSQVEEGVELLDIQ